MNASLVASRAARPRERQVQGGCAHLRADAAPAITRPEPGECGDCRERGKLGADEVLHPGGLAVDDHDKVQPPPAPVHVRAPRPDTTQPLPLAGGTVLVKRHLVIEWQG